ncbi:MAG: helix-turn-helix domain-containing protein [Bacteroidota bacterium]
MRNTKKRSTCPISYSLDLLGDKWVMLILRDIALADKHFYKEFIQSEEGIATNVLSDRLKMLETHGIIKSEPYASKKSMKYYTLTEAGIELIPVIVELWSWGAKHDPETVIDSKDLADRNDRKQAIISEIQKAACI